MSLKISIVTPVYNGESFLKQTIESIISQAGNFYIDYIIIYDGSTDTSLKIIREYAEMIRSEKWKPDCLGLELRYKTGPNRGQTQAYNTGFKMAKGGICAWMNADDYYLRGVF